MIGSQEHDIDESPHTTLALCPWGRDRDREAPSHGLAMTEQRNQQILAMEHERRILPSHRFTGPPPPRPASNRRSPPTRSPFMRR
jgi:hypothetical protein